MARLIGDAEHFWQERYYDFNIRIYPQFVEKLRYLHRNPVKAGLCERPGGWPTLPSLPLSEAAPPLRSWQGWEFCAGPSLHRHTSPFQSDRLLFVD